jgi:regulator of ribonuclease activity A
MRSSFTTTDLSDEFGHHAQVAEAGLADYGGVSRFSGAIATVWAFEDNSQVRTQLEAPGAGRVLVVDGGGSKRCALLGGNLAKLAELNGWTGILVNGFIRDRAEIAQCKIGVKALGHMPRKSEKKGVGAVDVPVTFAGVTFKPGDILYADEDGVVVVAEAGH